MELRRGKFRTPVRERRPCPGADEEDPGRDPGRHIRPAVARRIPVRQRQLQGAEAGRSRTPDRGHRAQAARGDAVAGHGAHDRRPTRRAGARDRGRVMNPASATATLPGADDPRSAMATAANAPTPMSGACWLVQALAAEGVDTLFGYPGGALMPFYDPQPGAGLRPGRKRVGEGK